MTGRFRGRLFWLATATLYVHRHPQALTFWSFKRLQLERGGRRGTHNGSGGGDDGGRAKARTTPLTTAQTLFPTFASSAHDSKKVVGLCSVDSASLAQCAGLQDATAYLVDVWVDVGRSATTQLGRSRSRSSGVGSSGGSSRARNISAEVQPPVQQTVDLTVSTVSTVPSNRSQLDGVDLEGIAHTVTLDIMTSGQVI